MNYHQIKIARYNLREAVVNGDETAIDLAMASLSVLEPASRAVEECAGCGSEEPINRMVEGG